MRYTILVLLFGAFSMLHASGEVPSYQKSFDALMVKKKSSPPKYSKEEQNIMKQAVESLAKSHPNPGIHVGEKVPNFTLKNAFDKEIDLYDELKKGPIVLVFYRGAWCPFCNIHLQVLQESLSEFKKYDAQLITVTPQTPDKSEEQIIKNSYPFEVLSDVNNHVMKAYKLYFEVPKEVLNIYKKNGLDIKDYNGENSGALPIPGSFVIDSNGIVRAMQAQTDYKKRMEPQVIIETLRKITKEKE